MNICLSFLNVVCSVYCEDSAQEGRKGESCYGVSLCNNPRTFTMGSLMGSLIAYLYLGGHVAEKKKHRGWRRNLYAKPTPCSLVLIFQCCNNQHHVIAPAKAITIICMSTVSLVFPYSAYREEDSCCLLPFEKKTKHAKQSEEIFKQVMTTWVKQRIHTAGILLDKNEANFHWKCVCLDKMSPCHRKKFHCLSEIPFVKIYITVPCESYRKMR